MQTWVCSARGFLALRFCLPWCAVDLKDPRWGEFRSYTNGPMEADLANMVGAQVAAALCLCCCGCGCMLPVLLVLPLPLPPSMLLPPLPCYY